LGELTFYGDDIRVERKLYSFTFEYAVERLGAEVYYLQTVCIVDPAEEVGRLLIGGAYLDSQMRAFDTHGPSYLVVVDGEPLGFTYWDVAADGKLMKTNMDGSRSEFESKEELIAYFKK